MCCCFFLSVYISRFCVSISPSSGDRFCFLASLTIESLQLALSATGLMMPRTFDVDDLMVNTFGGAAGFCFSALVCRAAGKRVRLKQRVFKMMA
ncbi:VanZ family protein [Bacillus sonorensis]|nr:VanZ family protein [Bacillus sonorensis]